MKSRKLSFLFAVTSLLLLVAWLAMVPQVSAAPRKITTPIENKHITSPKEFLGHDVGEDYYMANYSQDMIPYWMLLAQQSDRIHLEQIGITSEGRPMIMAIITSPNNWKNINAYKRIAKRLALAEGVTEEEAKDLASKGKTIISIDAGMHATEWANPQAMIVMTYNMATRNDEETLRVLEDCIILGVPSNPDGMDLVVNWYMNDHVTGLPQTDPLRRSSSNLPVLYQKHIAHDNNRDYLAMYMPESQALSYVFYKGWYPQFHYCQHQSGPSGLVLFIGAVRNPVNPNIENLVVPTLELFSSYVHSRYVTEDKGGAGSRTAANYSTWHNGMVRTSGNFHNMPAILSEITGNPTPTRISFNSSNPRKYTVQNDIPLAIDPQDVWHMSQCIDWLQTAYSAFFDLGSRYREHLLFNRWRMGMNNIERGNQDYWTVDEKLIGELEALPSSQRTWANFKNVSNRDPRGFIITKDQPDFSTAIKFVNMLLRGGATVLRATQDFTVEGKSYPAGSFVVKTAQAFRGHVMDALQPMWHPNDIPCPGSPPTSPYDVAGYTMALQTGITYDKVYEGFDGPFVEVPFNQWDAAVGEWVDEVKPDPQTVERTTVGYFLDHRVNDSFIALNRLMRAGAEVYWLAKQVMVDGAWWPAGTMYIPYNPNMLLLIENLARNYGLRFVALNSKPTGDAFKVNPVRIGIADVYGGTSTEGWTEHMLEAREAYPVGFDFTFNLVYPQELNAGNLNAKYDVLLFEDGLLPAYSTSAPPALPNPANYPPDLYYRVGSISAQGTGPKLTEFLQNGGTIIAIGSSTRFGSYPQFNLPIKNHLVDASGNSLPSSVFYVPGSVLEARLDTSLPITWGMPEFVNIFFDGSPTWDITTPGPNIQKIGWFDSTDVLRSGWAWGGSVLKDGVSLLQAKIGSGTLFLFGPDLNFRMQPHQVYKFYFNALYYGRLTGVTL